MSLWNCRKWRLHRFRTESSYSLSVLINPALAKTLQGMKSLLSWSFAKSRGKDWGDASLSESICWWKVALINLLKCKISLFVESKTHRTLSPFLSVTLSVSPESHAELREESKIQLLITVTPQKSSEIVMFHLIYPNRFLRFFHKSITLPTQLLFLAFI